MESKPGRDQAFKNKKNDNIISKGKSYVLSDKEWVDIVPKELAEGLIELGFASPSIIQAKTILAASDLLNRVSILQSQNGTGKTLAILIPLLLRIDNIGPADLDDGLEGKQALVSPQAIIVAHSHSICIQILSVAKCLKKLFPAIKVGMFSSRNSKVNCHILITTPTKLNKRYSDETFDRTKLKLLAVDEAEYLLNDESKSQPIIETAKSMYEKDQQILFFSVYYTKETLNTIYLLNLPDQKVFKSLLTPKTLISPGITHYYQISTDPFTTIAKILKFTRKLTQGIIFVSSKAVAEKLLEAVEKSKQNAALCLGGYDASEMGLNNSASEMEFAILEFNKGELKNLIATNVLARGFDTRKAGFVINLNLPVKYKNNSWMLDVEMYLHRAGRTGRFGQGGLVFNILSHVRDKDNIEVLEKALSCEINELDWLPKLKDLLKAINKKERDYEL